jgi:hypothetical protein
VPPQGSTIKILHTLALRARVRSALFPIHQADLCTTSCLSISPLARLCCSQSIKAQWPGVIGDKKTFFILKPRLARSRLMENRLFSMIATPLSPLAYTNLDALDDAVAWDLITEQPRLDGYCQYWQNNISNSRYVDRMERRQAEFLVKDRVPLTQITRIGVFDSAKQHEVETILAKYGVYLPVEVMRAWYF